MTRNPFTKVAARGKVRRALEQRVLEKRAAKDTLQDVKDRAFAHARRKMDAERTKKASAELAREVLVQRVLEKRAQGAPPIYASNDWHARHLTPTAPVFPSYAGLSDKARRKLMQQDSAWILSGKREGFRLPNQPWGQGHLAQRAHYRRLTSAAGKPLGAPVARKVTAITPKSLPLAYEQLMSAGRPQGLSALAGGTRSTGVTAALKYLVGKALAGTSPEQQDSWLIRLIAGPKVRRYYG